MNSKLEYIKENLPLVNEMIENKRPKFEIARVLGIKYNTLDRNLKLLGIEYKGNPNRKGIPHLEGRVLLEEYFNGSRNVTAPKLRNKLIEEGIKEEKCECCGLSEWMGKKIPLELHHKNMNHYDNSLENLQILCSNCHALAHEYSNAKSKKEPSVNYNLFENYINENKEITTNNKNKTHKKEKPKRFCECCGKEITGKYRNEQKFCSYECAHIAARKIPILNELVEKLNEFKFNKSRTGRFFGVSDGAIRKWIKKYDLNK